MTDDSEALAHLYRLLFTPAELGLCGCGGPDEAYALVRDVLSLAPFYDDWKAVEQLIGERACYFVLYQLDRCDLIEHGGGIGGSWLTEKGKLYLGLMKQYSLDQVDESGLPHDGGDCPAECPYSPRRLRAVSE